MKNRVVILGGGFGGAYCAQELQRRSPDTEVLLLDRNNYFVFYPLLIEAGTGSLQPNHVVVPVRSFVRNATFKMAEVLDVDFSDNRVYFELQGTGERNSVRYDQLVITLGSVTRMPALPGLREHAFEVKSLGDAIRLRDRAIRLIEEASAIEDERRRRARLHFVVVGGNFTGAEVAGEFHTYMRRAARRYPNLHPDDCQVTLIELSDRILGSLDQDLSEFARANLERRGVDVRTETSVAKIDEDRVHLDNGEVLESATVVWCAGIEPNPLVDSLDLPKDKRGYLLCDPDLRVRGRKNVWAIGDCAVNPDEHGRSYPSTAQHAVRQGLHLARNIIDTLSDRSTTDFRFKTLGSLVALGCRSGVAKIGPLKLSGFAAWWLHRTAYLIKMPGLSRKVRVALDWTLDLLFARDYLSLGEVYREGSGATAFESARPSSPTKLHAVEG
jgi:NADH dehydrogenase